MEEWYSNNTLQNNSVLDISYDSYNDSYDYFDGDLIMIEPNLLIYLTVLDNEEYIACWIVIVICPPLIILAIYYLYSLVRHNHMIYVSILYYRYLLIAWPLWYRSRRTMKVSVVVCVVVWVSALVVTCSVLFIASELTPIGVILLLPFPVLIFSVVGIFKGLSAAISVSSEEKRRIVGATILVLLNYTLLFLPYIIVTITQDHNMTIPYAFMFFNPLGDLVLYVFMRKGAIDKILASVCCCRMETQQQQTIAVNDDSTKTVSSV
ncbi:ovarian cancer G-protein coupled receptor 1-like [Scomber scombrus]|uniref:Ovarian cancer G-protein coupled receptor 1-like n=1 Tax=Scomber scombrus TaxID=13677 RepID=A0AAV1QI59_SCOSC